MLSESKRLFIGIGLVYQCQNLSASHFRPEHAGPHCRACRFFSVFSRNNVMIFIVALWETVPYQFWTSRRMAVGKNKGLKIGGKKGAKKKIVDPFTRKDWWVVGPDIVRLMSLEWPSTFRWLSWTSRFCFWNLIFILFAGGWNRNRIVISALCCTKLNRLASDHLCQPISMFCISILQRHFIMLMAIRGCGAGPILTGCGSCVWLRLKKITNLNNKWYSFDNK